MARRTAKYVAALETAQRLNIPLTGDQDSLYSDLNAANFFWDSGDKRWAPGTTPDPASTVVRVRVWAEASSVRDIAEEIARRMTRDGYELLERSEPYQCRPPKQLEARVYLTFRHESTY